MATESRSAKTALLAAVLFLAGGVLAAVEGPPDLLPVPEPFVDNFEVPVQELLRTGRRELDARLADGSTPVAELAEAFGEIGQMYLHYNLTAAAEAALGNAATLAPGDFRWPYLRAALLRADGRLEEAEALLRRALELEPGYAPTRVRLGQALLDLGRPAEALEQFREAHRHEPSAATRYALGRALFDLGETERAVEHFEAILELEPRASSVHHQLGLAHRRLGNPEEARRHLAAAGPDKVTFSDPLWDALGRFATGFTAHFARGNRALEQGNPEAAADELRRALEFDPESASAHLNLAAALSQLGRMEEALHHLERATEDDRTRLAALVNAGLLEAHRGRHAPAVEHFRAALALRSDLTRVRFNLGTALGHLGRFEEAATEYRRVVELDPADEPSWLALATALALAGRDGEAHAVLEEALRVHPRSGPLRHALARLLASSSEAAVRDGERALELARQLVAEAPLPARAETVAMALAELGRFEEAVEWQEAASSGMPGRQAPERLDSYRRGRPLRTPWRQTGVLVTEDGQAPLRSLPDLLPPG